MMKKIKNIYKYFYEKSIYTEGCPDKFESIGFIITTYKRDELVVRCIKSILKQISDKDKIIVIDDNGNKDNLVYKKIKADFDNLDQVIYIQNINNIGLNGSRNIGIEYSIRMNFDYITYIDDDDYMIEDSLRMVRALCNNNKLESWYLMPMTREDNSKTYINERNNNRVDYILDYSIGNTIRGDATHFISTKIIGGIRFPGSNMENEQYLFFEEISRISGIVIIPIPMICVSYGLNSMTIRKYYQNIEQKIFPRIIRISKNISWLPYILFTVGDYNKSILFFCWFKKTTKDILILIYYIIAIPTLKIIGEEKMKRLLSKLINNNRIYNFISTI